MEVRTEFFPLFYRIENESFSRIAFKYFLTNFQGVENKTCLHPAETPMVSKQRSMICVDKFESICYRECLKIQVCSNLTKRNI